MQLPLSGQLMQFLRVMQGSLFPRLEEQLGPLTGKQRQLIALLELIQIEATLTGLGATPVAGTVTCAGSVATFTASSLLTVNTLYTATISTGAQDIAGILAQTKPSKRSCKPNRNAASFLVIAVPKTCATTNAPPWSG